MPRQGMAEMPKTPRNLPKVRRVEIVVFPRVQLLDVAGPMQVFATANEFAGEPAPYDVHVVAKQAGAVATSAGLTVVAEGLASARTGVDTLVVAGGVGVYEALGDAALVGWVRRRAGVRSEEHTSELQSQ